VQGVANSILVPSFQAGESQIGGNLGMEIGGLVKMQGRTYIYTRAGGGLEVEVDGSAAGGASRLTMSVHGFSAGVSGADVGMVVTAQGGIALQSNMLENQRGKTVLEFPTLMGIRLIDPSSVKSLTTVYYNDTGRAQDLTINRRVALQTSKPLVVKVAVQPPDGFPGAPLAGVDMRSLEARMLNFVRLEGDFVVKRRSNGDFLMSSSSASLKLITGTDAWGAGIIGSQFGILVEKSGGIAFHASAARQSGKTAEESGIYIKMPEAIGKVSVERVTVDFNNTGHLVNENITVVNSNGVSSGLLLQVPLGSANLPFAQLEIINLQASIGPGEDGFFDLSGDFAFKMDQGAVVGISRNANLSLKVGDNELSVRNGFSGLQINPDGGFGLDASGTPNIRLAGLTDVKADRLRFGWNSTGAAIKGTLTVGELSVPMNLGAGTKGSPYAVVVAEGFIGRLGSFLKISGDFAFQRTGTAGGGDITVAVTDADATFETPAFRAGVVDGNMGMILRASGGVAMSISGEPFFVLGEDFARMFGPGGELAFVKESALGGAVAGAPTLRGIGFEYNSTGSAVDQELAGGFAKTLQLPSGTESNPFVSAIVTGLKWNLGDFASLAGDFAFQYRSNGDLAIAAAKVAVGFAVGDRISGGVSGATVAMLIKKDGTYGIQTTGGAASLDLGSGFATVKVQGMGFSLNNTGSDLDEQLDMSAYRVGVKAPLTVRNQETSIAVTGLDATIGGFVTLSGDYAIRKIAGPNANDDQLIILTRNASAALSLGDSMRVGVRSATMALVLNEDQTLVLQATGSPDVDLGSGFSGVSVDQVGLSYNNTGRDMDQTLSIRVGGVDVSVPVKVENGVATVAVKGLQAKVVDFATLTGDFAFQKRPSSGIDPESFVATAHAANATLNAGLMIRAGVKNASVALIIRADQRMAFQATGSADISLGAGFAEVSATAVGVSFNNTGADIDREIVLKVGGVSVGAPLAVKNGVAAVVVQGLSASVGGFVTVSGDFGVRYEGASSADGERLWWVADSAEASLRSGSQVRAGVSGARLAMLVR
jgi:hypothetical protein